MSDDQKQPDTPGIGKTAFKITLDKSWYHRARLLTPPIVVRTSAYIPVMYTDEYGNSYIVKESMN